MPLNWKIRKLRDHLSKVILLQKAYGFIRSCKRILLQLLFLCGHLSQVVWIGMLSKLRRIDSKRIPKSADEIRMFMVIRNEDERLQNLLKYYRDKGVNRFFIVDNGSVDGSASFLLSQPDVHLFSTNQSYRRARFGQIWMNILLYKYGLGHWCVVGDADELFVYPYAESLSLRDLAKYMDMHKQTVINALVIDMYTDKPLPLSEFKSGEDPLKVAPYFDGQGYQYSSAVESIYSGRKYCVGGVRRRVFGVDVCLNKSPFIKFRINTIFEHSCHYVRGARPADITGATLHFKFFSNFIPLANKEAQREEHWDRASEYKKYAAFLNNTKDINLYCSQSVKFQDSNQLIRLGLMKTSSGFEKYSRQLLDLPPHSYHFLMNDYCNCACIFCNQTLSESITKEITLEKFKTILSHIPLGRVMNLHFTGGGEPLLSKDIFCIIEHINSHYPHITVSIRTNGLLIKKYAKTIADLNISSLEISVHGLSDQNDHIMQREGVTDTVFEGIGLLNDLLHAKNKKISKTFCTVVSRPNIHTLPALIKKAAELKIEKVIAEFCRYYPHRTGPKLPEKDSLYYHQGLYNRIILKSKALAWTLGVCFEHDPLFGQPVRKFSCSMPWIVMLVGPEGDVYPCCGGEVWFNDHVKSGKYYFGNLLKEPLLSFWDNTTYARLRKGLASVGNKSLMPECRTCHRLTYTVSPDIKEAHILNVVLDS